MKKFKKKGDLELDVLGKIIIAVVILVIVAVGIMILTGKGQNALNYIKNLLTFRGN